MGSLAVIALGLGLASAAVLNGGSIPGKNIPSDAPVNTTIPSVRLAKWCNDEGRTQGQHVACELMLHPERADGSSVLDRCLPAQVPSRECNFINEFARQCTQAFKGEPVTPIAPRRNGPYSVAECEDTLDWLRNCNGAHPCVMAAFSISWCKTRSNDDSVTALCQRLLEGDSTQTSRQKTPCSTFERQISSGPSRASNSSTLGRAKSTGVVVKGSHVKPSGIVVHNATTGIKIKPGIVVVDNPRFNASSIIIRPSNSTFSNTTINHVHSKTTVGPARDQVTASNRTSKPIPSILVNGTTTFGHQINVTVVPLGHSDGKSFNTTVNITAPGPVRRPCSPQTAGTAPLPLHDTAGDFLNFDKYAIIAKDANTPQGYIRVFENAKASVDLSTFISGKQLNKYDPMECARECDAVSSCGGFNIFVQRDPIFIPGPRCPNPASSASFRCALFGSFLGESSVTDRGSSMEEFEVMIAGSNGYNRKQILPNRIDGFGAAVALPGSFHISQSISGSQLVVGPYEPAQCAILCNQELTMVGSGGGSAKSSVHAHRRCGYFNAFLAVLNTKPVGTFCALYANAMPAKNATLKSVEYDGKKFEVAYSYGYAPEN
ncbi:hypothetical protein EJ05DRAFT_45766 [Pseudovirgaria hyperparasitica]|uniref:Apple domain-containing protein n=1 Tax=Pseudovirgaria hyperparasitica TaxID=470096 RepID=A0A6A6W497_9PEZI|nr:uncharacterized protein EJ05DRAFT_45766 [Pseudovirgaria hyperparasitica]KAF2756854.1 hypothetical protein EJ05DRAFT_45766 [Pseudovirgaria hyperparasitica]